MINALRYTRKLEEVGFSRDQAETHVQIMTEIVEGDLVTKQDLTILDQSLKQEISEVRQELKQEIANLGHGLRRELKQEISDVRQELANFKQEVKQEFGEVRQEISNLENKIIQVEYRMTIKMGAMLTVAVGVLAAIAKL